MAADIEDFELVVVGGGKAGKSLAMDRARAGVRVAMVERDKIGGTCINVACIPTKALVASARSLITARRADQFGVSIDGWPSVTVDGLRAHKEGVVGGMVAAHRTLFHDSGMEFIMGSARFVAERTVEVALNDGSTRVLRGADVVINTGTTPGSACVARYRARGRVDVRDHPAAAGHPRQPGHPGWRVRRLRVRVDVRDLRQPGHAGARWRPAVGPGGP